MKGLGVVAHAAHGVDLAGAHRDPDEIALQGDARGVAERDANRVTVLGQDADGIGIKPDPAAAGAPRQDAVSGDVILSFAVHQLLFLDE